MEASKTQKNSRLIPFIGNDPVCESEHGGYIKYRRVLTDTSYLVPVSEHQKFLHDYAIQVQEAVKSHGID